MPTPFRIPLHEITESGAEIKLSQQDAWFLQAIASADEEAHPPGRKADAKIDLRQVDEIYVANGTIHSEIRLLCSRCGTPFSHSVNQKFSTLFCQDPSMAGVAHLQDESVIGRNQGHARHAHDETLGTSQDLDITYLAEKFIDLAALMTEQAQLTVPFQPLCREECKGVCLNCGTDLNAGRCACSKLNKKESPFAGLKLS
jgi:uncharacterized protein